VVRELLDEGIVIEAVSVDSGGRAGDDGESALAALIDAATTSEHAAAVLDETVDYLGAATLPVEQFLNGSPR
jgi:hypothetical protein